MPYCELNEIKSIFLKKFPKFTSNGFSIVITWKTRNIWSSFPLNDKSCPMYKEDCSYSSGYIGS